jgi:hypothetical protein
MAKSKEMQIYLAICNDKNSRDEQTAHAWGNMTFKEQQSIIASRKKAYYESINSEIK